MWLGQGTVWSEGNYEEVLMTLKKFKGNKLIMEEEVGGSEAVGGNCSHADPGDPCPLTLSTSTLPVVQGIAQSILMGQLYTLLLPSQGPEENWSSLLYLCLALW